METSTYKTKARTLKEQGDLRKCKFPDCGGKLKTAGLCAAHIKQRDRGQELRPLRVEGICELCGKTAILHWDHDHVTGRFRGWLCLNCNTGLGKLGDDIAGLKRAIAYLSKIV